MDSPAEDTVVVSVRKVKNMMITYLENIPQDRLSSLLTACCSKFGCGGNIVKDSDKPAFWLRGDQKDNIRRNIDTLFGGLHLVWQGIK